MPLFTELEENLKSCPLPRCRGRAKLMEIEMTMAGATTMEIICSRCGLTLRHTQTHSWHGPELQDLSAIELWNDREETEAKA